MLRPLIEKKRTVLTIELCVLKKVAVTLDYLKDTGSLCMTANTFGIAINTTSKIIPETCTAIKELLGPIFIHLPNDHDEMIKRVRIKVWGATGLWLHRWYSHTNYLSI